LNRLPVYTPEQCEVLIQNQGSPTVFTLRPMGLFGKMLNFHSVPSVLFLN